MADIPESSVDAAGHATSTGDEYPDAGGNVEEQSEQTRDASKVVHMRNLPQDISESEIRTALASYGGVARMLIMKQARQALVEFEDLDGAVNFVSAHTSTPFPLRSSQVYVQYSQHREIVTKAPPINAPTSILHVTIENAVFPITVEVLEKVFHTFGDIVKVAIFMKRDVQALVQLSNPEAATEALTALNGRNIYSGCCSLKIEYSNLPELNVVYNNERSRDFTNPSLPAGPASQQAVYQRPMQYAPRTAGYADQYAGGSAGPGRVLQVANLHASVTPDILFILFGVYGDVMRVKILYQRREAALIQVANESQARCCEIHLNGCPLFGQPLQVSISRTVPSVTVSRSSEEDPARVLSKDYSTSTLHRYRMVNSKNYRNIFPPSPVLFFSNLPMDITEQELIDLCSANGPVEAVQIVDKGKPLAWVQMSNVNDAVTTLIFTHNYQIRNNTFLRTAFAKNSSMSQGQQ